MPKHTIILFLAVVATALMIFFFSSQDGPSSNKTSGHFVDIVIKLFVRDFDDWTPKEQRAVRRSVNIAVRKTAHFSEYALFGLFLYLLLKSLALKKAVLLTLLIGAVYAALDETHQMFTGRTSKVTDVLIDFAGVLAGVIFVCLVSRLFTRIKTKKISGHSKGDDNVSNA